MCRYVDRLFDDVYDADLNETEDFWVSRLSDYYSKHGHLSNRQLEVLRDIHSRCSTRYDEDDDYWY